MKISFENKKVENLFQDYSAMKKTVGNERTQQIKKRIDQLKSAPSFAKFLKYGIGKPHPLQENLKGYYGVSITGNIRLVVKPNSVDLNPQTLENCDEVIVKGVGDYHGGKIEWIIS